MNASVKELAQRLHTAATEEKGLSLRIDGSEPTKGYAIGVEGFCMTLDMDLNHDVPLLAETWAKWAIDMLGFAWKCKPGAVLGVWCDDGFVYYDVSAIIEDRDAAISLGQKYHQKAIWDVAGGEEIRLSGLPPEVCPQQRGAGFPTDISVDPCPNCDGYEG